MNTSRNGTSRLPVVGGIAADLDGHPGLIGEQRQQLGAEPHCAGAVEPGMRCHGQGLPGIGRQRVTAEQPEPVQREVQAGQRCSQGVAFRVHVPVAGLGPARNGVQQHAPLRVAYLVGPLPGEAEVVAGAVGRAQHQGRTRDHRRREGAVRGDHGGRPPQPRVVLVAEPALLGGRNLQMLAVQRHALQLRRDGPGELGQPERAAWALGLRAVGVNQAVTLAADEPDRRDVGVRPVDPDQRRDHQGGAQAGCPERAVFRGGLAAGDVQAQFRAAMPRYRAALAFVHQSQADRLGLVQQRPELAGLERREVERLPVAVRVVCVIARLPGRRPVRGVHLLEQPHMGGRVVTVILQGIQPGPAQRAADPAAVLARLHQPGHNLDRRPASRPAAHVHGQGQLDGQRRPARPARPGGRTGSQQRLQRPLPRPGL